MAMMHDCKNKIYVRVVFASIMADLQRFAVDVELAHVLGPDVDVLDLFGDDVLALGQLEDVFPPVDDFQSSVRHPHTDVAGVVPPLFIYCLFSLFGVFVVALEHVGSLDAHLALIVLGPVLHLRYVDQFDTTAGYRGANVTWHVVSLDGESDRGATFRLAVSLNHL
jgi:hypothetical protein